MPTCSIEGVHPSILSIVGGIEVAEAVKIIIGKKPNLSEKILHIDLENLDFNNTRTFRAEECPICGTGKLECCYKRGINFRRTVWDEIRGKRTFSITPTDTFDLDVKVVTSIAKEKGFLVDNQGDLGLSMRTDELSVSFMKRGSAVVVGPKDEIRSYFIIQNSLRKRDQGYNLVCIYYMILSKTLKNI